MSANIFQQRRQVFAQQMQQDSVAIIPSAPERTRNRDSVYRYRQDSYFYYLTGFTEPNALLLVQSDGKATLFCQAKDVEREIWDGCRLGPEAAIISLAVDVAYPDTEMESTLPKLLENQTTLYFPFATHPHLAARVETWLEAVRTRARYGVLCPQQQRDACAILDEMRLIKDPSEQDLMRQAANISASAHISAMRLACNRLHAGIETREYHLEAALLHDFRMAGSEFPAYSSIVAAGANACVLHYHTADTVLNAGDLVLIDAGCELHGYASDITRTFPANGRFSGPQRALYEVVLAAQEAAIAATRPNTRFTEAHEAAVRIITQGLLDLKLLDASQVGSLDDAIAQRAYFPFYMHRTGHWLGMDVHDCGSYIEPGEQYASTSTHADPISGETIANRPARLLQPGMVLTIEPGLYVRPGATVPEAFHHIGIRIEDDAIVTREGCELISRGVPVAADAIEAMMCGSA